MNVLRPKGVVAELTIGTEDVNALTLGGTKGDGLGPIKAFRVLSGTGILRYVDDTTGNEQTIGDISALGSGDEIDNVLVRSFNGTGNDNPSAALTLRVLW